MLQSTHPSRLESAAEEGDLTAVYETDYPVQPRKDVRVSCPSVSPTVTLNRRRYSAVGSSGGRPAPGIGWIWLTLTRPRATHHNSGPSLLFEPGGCAAGSTWSPPTCYCAVTAPPTFSIADISWWTLLWILWTTDLRGRIRKH